MESIVIKDVLLNERTTSILIENNLISGIGDHVPMPDNAFVIEGKGKAALPSFANMHTLADDNEIAFQRAVNFVEQTKPLPQPNEEEGKEDAQ